MNVRTTRSRLTGGVCAALVTGALALGATPASASASDGYVSGGSSVYDDFGDEGTLSSSSHSSSNAGCLWQVILYADGAIEQNGTRFDVSDIDGHFGKNTWFATRNWQKRHGVTVDGAVGGKTFGKADGKYRRDPGGKLEVVGKKPNGTLIVRYHGLVHAFELQRPVNGRYSFTVPAGAVRTAGYDYNSCD
ncbi:peptidoglycan-binding domain-containing protein [Streptomyces sp. NPDC052225]|uniref:peptidoglycan-binding domain-containing protein n=1 Tax=Streptomyces sp. NPDC052225 TaxID=3154949 RepID=UPI00342DDCC2